MAIQITLSIIFLAFILFFQSKDYVDTLCKAYLGSYIFTTFFEMAHPSSHQLFQLLNFALGTAFWLCFLLNRKTGVLIQCIAIFFGTFNFISILFVVGGFFK